MFEQPILVVNVVLLVCLIVVAGYRRTLSLGKAALAQGVSVAFGMASLILLLFNVALAEMWGWTIVGSLETFSISSSVIAGSFTLVLNLRPSMLLQRKGKTKRQTHTQTHTIPAPPASEKADELPELALIGEKLREKGSNNAKDSEPVPVEENASAAS